MKKTYEEPIIEIVLVQDIDIITGSNFNYDNEEPADPWFIK